MLSSAVVLCLTGCGPESRSPAPAPTAAAEVRGEPIRGESIAPSPGEVGTVSSTNAAPDPDRAPSLAATETRSGNPIPGANTPTSVANGVPAGAVTAPIETVRAPSSGGPGAVDLAGSPAAKTNVPPKQDGLAKQAATSGVTDKAAGTAASPLSVGFEKLASFSYALPEGPVENTNQVAQVVTTNQIPEGIRSLNNQFVSLKGFMLPLKVEKGLVTELLIMRDQSMCCYGTVPKINEWVSVKMVGDGVKPIMDQAVTMFGKLKVGEMYENGYLVGIYALDAERMAGPLDL